MRNWEKYIRKVEPYVPGEQPKDVNVVKLNTNENPYPPTPKALEAVAAFDIDRLRLYPDPEASVLIEAISKRYNINKNQIFVGVGSDDVISMCFMTFFNSKKPILFPDITYSFYDVWADVFRIPVLFPDISYSFYSVWADVHKVKYETVALDENFNIIPETFYKENGGIIFPNPNAPTALYMELDKVEDIIRHNQDSVVIIDEAYIDFGGKSAIDFVNKYDNVIVVQTYSKSRSMAGVRIGFAFGSPELIKALNDVKFSFNSYTMNAYSLICGVAAMEDEDYFNAGVSKIINTRETAKSKLKELGFSFPDSKANFIFAKHESVPAKVIFDKLKQRGIYVRYFNKEKIDNYLRISIGTDEQMEKLYAALKEIIKEEK